MFVHQPVSPLDRMSLSTMELAFSVVSNVCLPQHLVRVLIYKLIWPNRSDNDTATLAAGFVITNQSIGDALKFAYFDGVDGIIGVGPVDLTQGKLSPDTGVLTPTIMGNALKQGLIKQQIFGILFAPATTSNDTSMCLSYLTCM